jgi:EmrB/QacA subfamily drug resistance transporter
MLSKAQTRTVMVGAMLALFLSALDQTIVATALPSIGGQFGDFELISWVVTAYLLTATCATPILGKLSDLYGRRVVLSICVAIFLGGSVLCALANSMVALIIARGIQGAGGGGLLTLAQAIVADVVPPRERGRYAGYFATVWALSSLLGPTLGGFLTEYAGWPWIFWINLPTGVVALAICDRVLRHLPIRRRPARIDLVSIGLFWVSSFALLLALSWGHSVQAWLSPAVLGLVAAAILCGGLFLARQKAAQEPILPPRMLTDAAVGPALTSVFLVFGSYLAIAVLTPVYFQVALRVPVSETGLLMIPLMLSTTFGASGSGILVTRTGSYKWPPLLGLPLAALILAVLAGMAKDANAVTASLLLMVAGFGIGTIFPTTIVAAQNAVAQRDLGTITGAIAFSRGLGGTALTAVASALVLGLIAAWLPDASHLAGLEDLARRPLTPPEQRSIAAAFGVLFGAVAVLMIVATLIYSRIESRPLRTTAAVSSSPEGTP